MRVKHVVVPGTFDPLTLGHLDVIKRSSKLFERVTVGVAASVGKRGVGTAFSLDERVAMIQEVLEFEEDIDTARVNVRPFSGLLVDFCKQIDAQGVVKGLRAMTDFEYELQQANLNARMAPELESVFVMSSSQYGYLSSSIVREVAHFGGDVTGLVPPTVHKHLLKLYTHDLK